MFLILFFKRCQQERKMVKNYKMVTQMAKNIFIHFYFCLFWILKEYFGNGGQNWVMIGHPIF
jgi:hypothetical protein